MDDTAPCGGTTDAPAPKIGKNEIEALAEIASNQAHGLGRTRPFWWRQASMRKLSAHGLVEIDLRFCKPDAKIPAWKITEAGCARLRGPANV